MIVPEKSLFCVWCADKELLSASKLALSIGDSALYLVVRVRGLCCPVPEPHLVADHDGHGEPSPGLNSGWLGKQHNAVLELDLIPACRDNLFLQQRNLLGQQRYEQHVGLRGGQILGNIGHHHILPGQYIRQVAPEQDLIEDCEGRYGATFAAPPTQDPDQKAVLFGYVGDWGDRSDQT